MHENDLLRIGANLGNNKKCGIQIGAKNSKFNCGYIHFYHISDGNSGNYLSFSTHTKDHIFKMLSTGECIVSDKLTTPLLNVTNDATINGNSVKQMITDINNLKALL